jgi:hypothetical protein
LICPTTNCWLANSFARMLKEEPDIDIIGMSNQRVAKPFDGHQ